MIRRARESGVFHLTSFRNFECSTGIGFCLGLAGDAGWRLVCGTGIGCSVRKDWVAGCGEFGE